MRFAATTACLIFPVCALAMPVPAPPAFKASSYVLMDYDSGQIIAARDPELRVEPASLTKLMTCYIAFDQLREGRLKPTDLVLISERAWRSIGSRSFLEVGRQVDVETLLHGIVVQSGNDASIALAEHIAGTEETFAQLMNQYAQRLGLTQTQYANATGLPHPELHTSARDMALLARAMIRNFPEHYALYRIREYTYNNIRQPNRNRLLWRDDAVDGIKTGHTSSAGYHLTASAIRDGRRLISVVIGTDGEEQRAQASLALLNYGFRFFETVTAAEAGQPVTTIRAWKGAETELALGVAEPLAVSVPRGAARKLELRPQVDGDVFAPVSAGQRLGTLEILLDGELLRSEPLVALAELPAGGLWRALTDEVRLRFRDLTAP
jgi:serine-type D-Ala-D-Ala carboxypeptidase (penicillin-binding protein 5/6)